jgi:hypothetical protein
MAKSIPGTPGQYNSDPLPPSGGPSPDPYQPGARKSRRPRTVGDRQTRLYALAVRGLQRVQSGQKFSGKTMETLRKVGVTDPYNMTIQQLGKLREKRGR